MHADCSARRYSHACRTHGILRKCRPFIKITKMKKSDQTSNVMGTLMQFGAMMAAAQGAAPQSGRMLSSAVARCNDSSVNVSLQHLRMLDECMGRVASTAKNARNLCSQMQASFNAEVVAAEDCRSLLRNLARDSGQSLHRCNMCAFFFRRRVVAAFGTVWSFAPQFQGRNTRHHVQK